jgi:hypothetical protein
VFEEGIKERTENGALSYRSIHDLQLAGVSPGRVGHRLLLGRCGGVGEVIMMHVLKKTR